ncbi:MAG: hypothetical protein KAT70_02705 [Thermoplasmata archaeon]|nr:hypothetical protein [Thermoplasmata archaeon]
MPVNEKIKLNSKCEQCKKTGITYEGKCVLHWNEAVAGQPIGRYIVTKIVTDVAELLICHLLELNQAYDNGDQACKISMPVNVVVSDDNGLDVETKISFSTGKVTDSRSCTIDEKQGRLFEDQDDGGE